MTKVDKNCICPLPERLRYFGVFLAICGKSPRTKKYRYYFKKKKKISPPGNLRTEKFI